MNRDGRDFAAGPPEIVHEALLLVSCSSIMRLLEMNGAYPLSNEAIDQALTRASPGNYALGYLDDASFVVFYVGRSDSDVRRRLHDWVGFPSRYHRYAPASKAAWTSRHGGLTPLGPPALAGVGVDVDSSYTHFAYSYASSAEAAFEKECRNYCDFGGSHGLDNEFHPMQTPRSPAERLARVARRSA